MPNTVPEQARRAISPMWWLTMICAIVAALASLACTALSCRTSSAATAAARLHPWAIRAHLVLGPSALILGVAQFYPDSCQRDPRRHGWLGRWYLGIVLALALTGFWLARTASGGTMARAGFMTLALALVVTARMAYAYATAGAVGASQIAHEDWVARNYALLYAAVVWPLLVPIAHVPYRWAAWLCWAPSLVITECYRRWRERRILRY